VKKIKEPNMVVEPLLGQILSERQDPPKFAGAGMEEPPEVRKRLLRLERELREWTELAGEEVAREIFRRNFDLLWVRKAVSNWRDYSPSF